MAGLGANTVLDKGILALSTYNSSAAAGVVAFRTVKWAAGGTFDLSVADTDVIIGVVQENIDQVKVATGKAVADIRLMGITTVLCTTAASIVLGSKLTPSTNGGVKLAATGDVPCGIAVGITGTIADGNLIQMLLTPGMPLLA
jgi:high-affinity K+ transport system ATPase subunit B